MSPLAPAEVLGHRFSEPALLRQALHFEMPQKDFQRLEFLGDAVLSLIIAQELMARWPDADEGVLTEMRIAIVQGDALAEHFHRLKLNELVKGARKFVSASQSEDIFEAIVGAVFADAGYEKCHQLVRQWFADLLDAMDPQCDYRHPKTRLQEFLQKHSSPLPLYELQKEEGGKKFIQCSFDFSSRRYAVTASAATVREAERKAAEEALQELPN